MSYTPIVAGVGTWAALRYILKTSNKWALIAGLGAAGLSYWAMAKG